MSTTGPSNESRLAAARHTTSAAARKTCLPCWSSSTAWRLGRTKPSLCPSAIGDPGTRRCMSPTSAKHRGTWAGARRHPSPTGSRRCVSGWKRIEGSLRTGDGGRRTGEKSRQETGNGRRRSCRPAISKAFWIPPVFRPRSPVRHRQASAVHRRPEAGGLEMSEKRLRIAVFHCGFAYSGGGERIVLEEVNGLRGLGHKVVCYAPTLNRKMCYPDLIKEVGVRTFLPQLPSWFPLRDAIAMALSSLLAPILALGFIGTDVFVGANQPGAWIAFCMARVLGRPYVVYLNQPNRLIYPRRIDQETGWLTKPDYHILDVLIQRLTRFVGWADRISFTEAEVMLANGGYIAGVIESIYGRQQVLCPAGCNPQPREGLPSKPLEAYRGNFEINGFKVSKPYVLITNRHEPQKKFEYVIEAMALTRVFAPEASLVIPV